MQAGTAGLLVLHLGTLATVGGPLRAQQETARERIAVSRMELPPVPTDSNRSFERRLVDALESDTALPTVMAPEEMVRRLQRAGQWDAWHRVIFTFVTAGIVDPIDLAATCELLDVDRILHVEAAELVDRRPVYAHGQVLLGTRAVLSAWLFDCHALDLTWEHWSEGIQQVAVSTDVAAASSLATVGAVSRAVAELVHTMHP
jgi:hypothetical protein